MTQIKVLIVALVVISLAGCGAEPAARAPEEKMKESDAVNKPKSRSLPTTEEQWRKVLTPEQYYVLREKGTERAFTGKYHDTKASGTFVCAGCGEELFKSTEKFNSGTGWPSFWQPATERKVKENVDVSHGMRRVEVVCQRCGGHLGHVFDDGPRPTGKRYCINSVSLVLEEKKEDVEKK